MKHGESRVGSCLAGLLAFATAVAGDAAVAYPLDGFEWTGIGRLAWQQKVEAGEIRGQALLPPGSKLPLSQVQLRMLGNADYELPTPDPALTRALRDLLGGLADRYGLAVLDLTDPANPVYAEVNGQVKRNPGSVGKLVVALGLFQNLADAYPEDLEARRRLLRETVVTADEFCLTDSHTVKFYDPDTGHYERHPLAVGNQATLYEYLDWMVSASSNSAASMLMKHNMLLKEFGRGYPVEEEEIKRFFKENPTADLDRLLASSIQEPMTRNGFDLEQFRQGRFFTRTANSRIRGTSSHGTARSILQYLLRLEQGRIVDEFSSLEIKRLMFQSERRIRYAASPTLANAAVYFKSGSLFRCEPEPGFECKKYAGNALNLMNSAAIVETVGERPLHYLVALMSDVRRKNSASDHQAIATRLHRIIEKRHAP
jgi:hypothetical protein